jgi:hypothetical protein
MGDHTEMAEDINLQLVSQARQYVWGLDDGALSFVRKHICSLPDREIISEEAKELGLRQAQLPKPYPTNEREQVFAAAPNGPKADDHCDHRPRVDGKSQGPTNSINSFGSLSRETRRPGLNNQLGVAHGAALHNFLSWPFGGDLVVPIESRGPQAKSTEDFFGGTAPQPPDD